MRWGFRRSGRGCRPRSYRPRFNVSGRGRSRTVSAFTGRTCNDLMEVRLSNVEGLAAAESSGGPILGGQESPPLEAGASVSQTFLTQALVQF